MQGATFLALRFRSKRNCFNPRPYARGDTQILEFSHPSERFQSTPLCKGRLAGYYERGRNGRFNPRPYARGDIDLDKAPEALQVSIHAPMQGATGR